MLRKTTGAAARGYHKRRDAILLTTECNVCRNFPDPVGYVRSIVQPMPEASWPPP